MANHLTLEALLEKDAVTAMLHSAETLAKLLGLPKPVSGTSKLGPFAFHWEASGSLREKSGDFVLKTPDIFGIQNLTVDYLLKASFDLDLSQIIGIGSTITVPLSYSDSIPISGDFKLVPEKGVSNWVIKLIVVDALSIPVQEGGKFLERLSDAIGQAITGIPIPGISDLIGKVVSFVIDAIGAGSALNFLETILSELVTGFPLISFAAFTPFSPKLDPPYDQVNVEVDLQVVDLSATVRADNAVMILTGVGDINFKSQNLFLALQLSGQDVMLLSRTP